MAKIDRVRGPVMVVLSAFAIGGAHLPAGEAAPGPTIHRIIREPIKIPKFTPVSIDIPKIDVEAPIVPVGTESDGKMAAPGSGDEVGWWAGRKAGAGNLLLDGHHDWNGKVGSFYRLPELKKGDEIIVKGKKHDLTYRVIWVKNYDRNIDATDLLGNKGKPQVATLITCGGEWDSIAGTRRERVVARAELVST